MTWYYQTVKTGLVPEWLMRTVIRALIAGKSRLEQASSQNLDNLVAELSSMPIAIETDAANAQHYALPPRFFELVLGKHLKYSCALWEPGTTDLTSAEAAMLELYAERAQIEDGQTILDLGCGWGSFSLWAAPRYPHCQFTALSNSAPQRRFIEQACADRNITNLRVLTANIAELESTWQFDRIVSIEMFEHMKNYKLLLKKLSGWLLPGGKLFVHIFSHRQAGYHYHAADASDWIAQNFFSGGLMPADQLLMRFQDDLRLDQHWQVSGTHYQQTSEAWLVNMKSHEKEIRRIFAETYGREHKAWFEYWKVFFITVAELWGYKNGNEWMVSHYRFIQPTSN